MRTHIASKIYETDNYKKFRQHKANRGLTKTHVNKLAKSLKEYGWIDAFPMAVRATGKSFVIIDGHNRFAAAKQMDIPVKYTVVNGELNDDELCFINRTQRRWSTVDFVNSYANQGFDDYIKMRDFMKEFKIGVGVASALLTQGYHRKREIEKGVFEIKDEKWARDKIHWLIQINNVLLFHATKKNFVNVFVECCKLPGFEPKRLHHQIKKNPMAVLDLAKLKDMSLVIQDVYNAGISQKNRMPLAFLIEQNRLKKEGDK